MWLGGYAYHRYLKDTGDNWQEYEIVVVRLLHFSKESRCKNRSISCSKHIETECTLRAEGRNYRVYDR